MDVAELIYTSTRGFPAEETYGLKSQMRRAAVSIASNIAEGHARNTTGEYLQFIGHAMGSLAELETQVVLSKRLHFMDASTEQSLIRRSQKLVACSADFVSPSELAPSPEWH